MKKLLVWLTHNVSAFAMNDERFAALRCAVGDRYEVIMASDRSEFLKLLPIADQCVCWRFDSDWYELCPKLRTVYTPAAGHDWIAPDPQKKIRIRFGTFHGTLMRESLLAMMLHFCRRMDVAMADKKDNIWNRDRYSNMPTLADSHVAIIGYGAIGRQCAIVLKAFGCRVTGIKRHVTTSQKELDKLCTFDELHRILPTADHVVCLLPGGDDTDNLITAETFATMKDGAYFYNLGRGNCYLEENLTNALQNGSLAGAGLDVFAVEPLPHDSPLWNLDNVFITPHASAICKRYLAAYFEELAQTLQAE